MADLMARVVRQHRRQPRPTALGVAALHAAGERGALRENGTVPICGTRFRLV